MRKAKSNLLSFLSIMIMALIYKARSFQFMYVNVLFNPTVIKETAIYQFEFNRQTTSDLSNTNWSNEPIPANSTVRITFPQQYQPSDLSNFSCDTVSLDNNPVSSYSCNLNTTNNTIIISGLFSATASVGIINVELSNIRNPAPSITTDPFLGFVGNDYSSNDTRASVFFDPAQLNSFNVTFSNSTVNTTSDMILSLEIKNYFPSSGHIELTFPTGLQWSRDLSSSHPFPINGILSCEGITSNLNTLITCLGQSSTKIVAFTNLASTDIDPGTIITFKLKNMFSPPTTQTTNPSDALSIKTFDENSNEIQYKQSFVSGLTPRNLSTLQILPLGGQTNFIVNTWVGLNFTFNVADTMDYNDYFQMIFPTSTSIIYSTSSTTFKFGASGSTGVNFTSSNATLTMIPNNNSPSQITNNFVFIGFKSFLAPKSCRVQTIQLNVIRYGYGKMSGSASIHAETNKYYLQSLSLNNTEINEYAMLTVSFQLKDALSGTGMIVVLMPSLMLIIGTELTQLSSSISTSGMIKAFPTTTVYTYQQVISSTTNTTFFTCPSLGGCLLLTNLTDTPSTQIKSQNITMMIKGLQNVGYVTAIDIIGLRTFYDSQFDSRVAEISQNSTATILRTTNGMMAINSILWNTGITNYQSAAILTVSISNQNPIPTTGILLLFIPSELFIQISLLPNQNLLALSLWINNVEYIVNQSFPITNDTYTSTNTTNKNSTVSTYCLKVNFSTISLTSLGNNIPANTNITLVFSILSADSTQPLTVMNWYTQSFTQSMSMIDQFNPANNSNFIYRTMAQNNLTNINLYRSTFSSSNITTLASIPSLDDCQQNAQLCGAYAFEMQQQQPFQSFSTGSNNKNIVQIQIGRNIDLSDGRSAFLAIQSQLVYYDFQSIKVYNNNANMSSNIIWIPVNYTVQQLDNRTNAILFEMPIVSNLNLISNLTSTTYNRLSLPFPLTAQNTSSHVFILLENVRNPFSLAPFTSTYKTEKSIQNLNAYLYSSGTTSIIKNTQLLNITVTSFSFTSRVYQDQSSLNINISLNNWNQAFSSTSMKSSTRNNVRYVILAVGKGFTFSNISSLGFCVTTINNYTESNASCSIEQISPNFTWTQKINVTGATDIIDMLANSEYLVVFTLSDTFSSMLQSSLPTNSLYLSIGQFLNPSISIEQLSQYQKSISVFTLSQMEYLIHKSLLSIIFSTNCLSPCKECVFATNSSTEVSNICRTCSANMWLYNSTCLAACPINTYQSSKTDNTDNVTVINICLNCQSQCASCIDNSSCSSCDISGSYKYEFLNITTNLTTCLSQCPFNGYYANATTTTNITTNITTLAYECLQCKTNCSLCTNGTDCYKCIGSLLLYTNICVQTCPSNTIQLILPTVQFQNTTINSISVCETCAVYTNDTNCEYCSQLSGCVQCKSTNYSLDYLMTKKCLTQCTDGYFELSKPSTYGNYSYLVCEMCDMQCAKCSISASNCSTCTWVNNSIVSQYYQLGNSCYLAQNCPTEYYPNITTKTCASCSLAITGCITCSASINCILCNATAGYYNFTNTTTSSSICLTANEIPKGYILINETIQQCAQYCTNCSVITNNCTDCIAGYYVFNLQTGIGQCVSSCPTKYYPANYKLCTSCPSPCQTCTLSPTNISQILCSTCLITSGLYYFNNGCINAAQCPNTTYPYTDMNNSYRTCKQCENNCTECMQDGSTCLMCMLPYYLYNNSCVLSSACPSGTVGVVNSIDNSTACVLCSNNCLTCINTTSTCTSCQTTYYFIQQNNTCMQSCPSPLIQNLQNMTCVQCTSPCATCANTVTNCTSCVSGYFKYLNQCVTSNNCPLGYYGNVTTGNCQTCPIECSACTINQQQTTNSLTCQQCKPSYALYNGQCLSSCPSVKQYNVSGVCMSCSQAVTGCQSCINQIAMISSSGSSCIEGQLNNAYVSSNSLTQSTAGSSTATSSVQCSACSSPYILLNSTCVISCPSGYVLQSSQCITTDQNADNLLSQTLTNTTVMPLPMTIICAIIIMACLLSKLQNENSYLIGTVYSLVGIMQTISVGYLILRIISSSNSLKIIWSVEYNTIMLLFFICLALIYLTNIIALIIQSYLLSQDEKFNKYSRNHIITYSIVSFISLVTNYKFKLIILTKLFDFSCFKCQLQSIQKFNIFNLFSFFGLGHQGLLLYITGLVMAKYRVEIGNEFFLTILDVAIVSGCNCVLAIVVSKKGEDFFQQRHEGVVINRKIDAGSQEETHDFNKLHYQTPKVSNTAVEHVLSSSEKLRHYDALAKKKLIIDHPKQLSLSDKKLNNSHDASNQNLMQEISQDDQFSLSISHEDQTQSNKKSRKNIFDQPNEATDKSTILRQRQNSSQQQEGAMKSSSQLKRVSILPSPSKHKLHYKSNNKASASTGVIMRSFKSLQHLDNNDDNSNNNLFQKVQKQSKSEFSSPVKYMDRRCITESVEIQQGQQQRKKSTKNKSITGYYDVRGKYQTMDDIRQSSGGEKGEKSQENLQLKQIVDSREEHVEDLIMEDQQQKQYQAPRQQQGQLDRLPQSEQKELPEQQQECNINLSQNRQPVLKIPYDLQQENLQQQQISSRLPVHQSKGHLPIQMKNPQHQQKHQIADQTQQNGIIIFRQQQNKQTGQQYHSQRKLQGQLQQQEHIIPTAIIDSGAETHVVHVGKHDGDRVESASDVNQLQQSSNKIAEITQDQLHEEQSISTPIIKSTHLANNFFNQPLGEQLTMTNPTLLMEEKQKQLQRLRRSRINLQQENMKLKTQKQQKRSRSKSIHKQKGQQQEQQGVNEANETKKDDNKALRRDVNVLCNETENGKVIEEIQQGQLSSVRTSSNRLTARQILNLPSSSSRGREEELKQITPHQQLEEQQPLSINVNDNEMVWQIILLEEQQQQGSKQFNGNNLQQQQSNNDNNIYDRTISKMNSMEKMKREKDIINEQLDDEQWKKRRVSELLTARYNENRQQRKMLSQEDMEKQTKMKNYPNINSSNNNLEININNRNRDSDQQGEIVNKCRSKSKSKTNLNNQNSEQKQKQNQKQQKSSQQNRRIDLGEFTEDKQEKELDEEQMYYQSMERSDDDEDDSGNNNKQSKRRMIIDSNNNKMEYIVNTKNNKQKQSQQREINSLDRISPQKKIKPTTFRPPLTNHHQPPSQQRKNTQIAIHDTSFISSGKSNQTHYPLYYKSKQLPLDREESQHEGDMSFYNNFNYNRQENQFYQRFSNQYYNRQQHQSQNEIISQLGSNILPLHDQESISQHSNQLYQYYNEQSYNNNTQQNPHFTKPSTLPIPKYPPQKTKKMQDNDELSKLIAKNRNTIMTSGYQQHQQFKRSSFDKTTMQYYNNNKHNNNNTNQKRQSSNSRQRNMSAGIRSTNKSIQRSNLHDRTTTKQMQQQTDALDEYYHRGNSNQRQHSRQSRKSMKQHLKRSRSRSKQRPLSKQSQNKLKALQKIYLQKLQWKK